MSIYLNIPSIPGDTTAVGFKGNFECSNYSFGEKSTLGPNQQPGKPSFTTFSLTKPGTHVGATKLFLACALGTNLGTVDITVTKSGQAAEQIIEKFSLDRAVLVGYQLSGDSSDIPMEDLEFAFTRLTYSVTTYDKNGKGTTVMNFFDLAAGKGG